MTPLSRYHKLPDEKKKHLLDVARKEFATHGYDKASFNRIIKDSGISKGAMYYYFADKSDLFAEAITDTISRITMQVGTLKKADDADGYWQNVQVLMMKFDEAAATDPEMASIGRSIYSGGGADEILQDLRDRAEKWVGDRLSEGIPIGAVRTDIELPFLACALTSLLTGIDRWFINNMSSIDEERLLKLSTQLHQMCRDLVEPRS